MSYTPYFAQLNKALWEQSYADQPRLVIDKDVLTKNCKTIADSVQKNGQNLRIVAKSLPSLPLLTFISEQTDCQSFMVFHQPYLNILCNEFSGADMLLGKPMPIQAVEKFYIQQQQADNSFDASKQLQWLVDSVQRLEEYIQFAQQNAVKLTTGVLQINIEVDVGLHRGGIQTIAELKKMLLLIQENSEYVSFAGFMGYDAHVGKLPSFLEKTDVSLQKSQNVYKSFCRFVETHFADMYHDGLCFNGAGSPTYELHGSDSPLNDVSIGSAFVKPLDFDLPALTDVSEACFIATPVLKSLDGLLLPGPKVISDLWQKVSPKRRHSFFVYGGYWKAQPIAPQGLSTNGLYGFSSNQEMYNAPVDTGIKVNDLVFFRPTQSEAVLKEFAGLLIVDSQGTVTDEWSVFS